jgi:hypothetical protein
LFNTNRRCEAICRTHLSEGAISPYNSIRELQKYASGFVMSEPRPPKTTLLSNVETFGRDGKQLDLLWLDTDLSTLLDDTSRLLDEALLGQYE